MLAVWLCVAAVGGDTYDDETECISVSFSLSPCMEQ